MARISAYLNRAFFDTGDAFGKAKELGFKAVEIPEIFFSPPEDEAGRTRKSASRKDTEMGVCMMRMLAGLWVGLVCLTAGPGYAQVAPDTTALAPAEPDTAVLTILHSNDVYGQLLRQGGDGPQGGMAARVHLIRTLRAAGPALVLDAGDAVGPATLSAWDRGKTMVAVMRLAGYTAMTPGNHEFDYGLEELNQRQAEAGFPLLAANVVGKGGVETPMTAHLLVEAAGVKVGILGVVSQRIMTQTNPKHIENLTFGDPLKAAQASVQALREQGADYVIAQVHMREEEALGLARQVEGIDLVVAGGYRGSEQAHQVRALIRLVNGVNLVSTPKHGLYLGQVTVRFTGEGNGRYRAVRTDATLIPVTAEAPDDPEAAAMIAELEAAHREATGEVLNAIEGKTLEAQGRLVANLMRSHTQMEVGIANRGAFRQIATDGPLYLRDIDRFIRFDDSLVKLVLTGAQLKEIVKQSQGAEDQDKGLIFAGLDPREMTVNGRPIGDDEPYRVATVEFLVEGGDGYRTFGRGESIVRTAISLRSLLTAWLKVGPLSAEAFGGLERKRVWRSGWSVEGAFRRNFVNRTTEEYRAQNEKVSFLSGNTSIAWNSAARYFLSYEAGPRTVLFENMADFGQIGESGGNLETSSDRLDADLTYRRRVKGLKVDPFVSTGISTAFTKGDGARPFLWRGSAGFQRNLTPNLVGQFAGRAQRNYAVDENDYGAEATLRYQQRLPQGGRFRSDVKSFFGLSGRKVISVENYNTFSFPLVAALSLTVRQNNFIYRVDRIQDRPVSGVAFRTDLTVGFSYGLDWKWF